MHIVMALIVITGLSLIIVYFPKCKPVAKVWNPTISGTCWSRKTQTVIWYYQGGKTAKKYTLSHT